MSDPAPKPLQGIQPYPQPTFVAMTPPDGIERIVTSVVGMRVMGNGKLVALQCHDPETGQTIFVSQSIVPGALMSPLPGAVILEFTGRDEKTRLPICPLIVGTDQCERYPATPGRDLPAQAIQAVNTY